MAIYECVVCGYCYDEKQQNVPWEQLEEDWCCPICSVDKSQFVLK